jgi:carbamoyltransferase|nr:carbamoyltransferase N-terminal domain-containing protein [uncultured Desulfobacter sp.]
MMNILGISCYFHDSAAALISGKIIKAAAEEERFSRKKHDATFPSHAVEYCLKESGLDWNNIDVVVFYEKPLRKILRRIQAFQQYGKQFEPEFLKQLNNDIQLGGHIENTIRDRYEFTGEVCYCPHHHSHAASAFYPSGFKEAAILICDGVGEFATTTLGFGSNATFSLDYETVYPHSIGLLYSTFTAFLGFKINNDEYKVMGLAAYGEPKFVKHIEQVAMADETGAIILDLDYFDFHRGAPHMYSQALVRLLGPPRDGEGDPLTQRHADIAASVQRFLENALEKTFAFAKKEYNTDNICLAGGVALNGVANWKVFSSSSFQDIFIQPAAGDAGAAIGAALAIATQSDPVSTSESMMPHAFWGPSFSNEQIQAVLDKHPVVYEYMEISELTEHVAKAVWDNKIVGWFQGRMEFGPRALGNRSLLANPCTTQMQQIINRRVKLRESFRPFAPAVLEEYTSEFFELDRPSPYMLLVPQATEKGARLLPSTTHVDQSARVQTVSKAVNEKFYNLIEAFSRVSGVPVILNTSFNIRGEPIVCSPVDAVRCFLYTDIDMLAIGNFLVLKENV